MMVNELRQVFKTDKCPRCNSYLCNPFTTTLGVSRIQCYRYPDCDFGFDTDKAFSELAVADFKDSILRSLPKVMDDVWCTTAFSGEDKTYYQEFAKQVVVMLLGRNA